MVDKIQIFSTTPKPDRFLNSTAKHTEDRPYLIVFAFTEKQRQ